MEMNGKLINNIRNHCWRIISFYTIYITKDNLYIAHCTLYDNIYNIHNTANFCLVECDARQTLVNTCKNDKWRLL